MDSFQTDKYNFGIRKPILNCKNIIETGFWKSHLINKWVYSYDASEDIYIYFKHIFVNSRVLQIIISGLDIMGDGVYTIYKAEILSKNSDFILIPIDYNLSMGSFECEDYLEELLNNQYITKTEYEMFKHPNTLPASRKSMYELSDAKFQK